MKKWTQDEAIAYECARDTITHLRAILNHQVIEEEAKDHPDTEKIQRWTDEQSRLFDERRALRVLDQTNVNRVCTEYGARVRAWTDASRAQMAASETPHPPELGG